MVANSYSCPNSQNLPTTLIPPPNVLNYGLARSGLDATDDLAEGQQQFVEFQGYYGQHGDLPLLVTSRLDGGPQELVVAWLRRGRCAAGHTVKGSVESLKLAVRCGLRPKAVHTRCTVDLDTPVSPARVRQVQWVAPAGLVCSVDEFYNLPSGNGPRPARTRLVIEAVDALSQEALAPLPDGGLGQTPSEDNNAMRARLASPLVHRLT